MIERINLIERNPFRFTYGILLLGIGSIVVLSLLLMVGQIVREKMAEKKLTSIQETIEGLKEKQEDLMKAESLGLDASSGSALAIIFLKAPRWSLIIQEIATRLPGSVWLTSIRAAPPEEEGKAVKKEKKDKSKKEAPVAGKTLYLSGEARSPQDLSLFIAQLSESPQFTRVILASSKMDEGSFTFNLQCDMGKGK
ncbi:MAG: PilN domain-containing protein [Deltaproteobacteria bacterium]|nr:PilN domain-containing protein [Deltaproteobacteria bacterium]